MKPMMLDQQCEKTKMTFFVYEWLVDNVWTLEIEEGGNLELMMSQELQKLMFEKENAHDPTLNVNLRL